MAFLHGIETFEMLVGPRPIQQVRSAVIGLVGTAPVHHSLDPAELNRPELVLSDRNNPKFGPRTPSGYTIPDALVAIQDWGAGLIVCINVFDPTVHKASVAAANKTITDGVAFLGHEDVIPSTVVVRVADHAGSDLVLGTDYTLDAVTGMVTVVPGGALAAAPTLSAAYDRADPSAVDDEDIIGAVGEGGIRSGAQALKDVASLYGFNPKVLIAPGFSSEDTVQAALQVLADAMASISLNDAPVGISFEEALEARGTEGDYDMQLADDRVYYCFPWYKVGDALSSPSARVAGAIAKRDGEKGYWHSPSNQVVPGVTGAETNLTASISDENSEVNLLNAAGIMTIFTGSGLGIRVWGNRASSFPGSSDPRTFMPFRRTIDLVDEAIEIATVAHLDGPADEVLISAVLEDVGEFIKTLVTRKALRPGSRVEVFPEDNPPSELAAGHITFTKTYCPPVPAERITYKTVIDINLLAF